MRSAEKSKNYPFIKQKRKIVRHSRLFYPISLREKGIEGKVKLLLKVNSNGNVIKVIVVESSGYPKFDDSAKKSVKKYKYERSSKRGTIESIFLTNRYRLNNS